MRCLVLLGFLFANGVCLAQDMAELEVDHTVKADFATPHTNWAVPYALGKTRVLFFLRGHGTEPREVTELQQRFDFESQMVFWTTIIDSTKTHWHGDERGIQRMARQLAQKWDACVFLSPVSPEMMPVDLQYAMFKAITEGAGLVFIGSDDKRVLKAKNQLKELPPFLRDVDGAEAFTIKQGRGVRLRKRPSIPYRPGWEVEYDEWAMRVGKAILWAAGKEPKLSLTLRAKSQQLARATLPSPAATLQWQGASPGSTADIKLRRDDGAVMLTARKTLKTTAGVLDLTFPLLRAGRYDLDAVARNGDTVTGFGSVSFTVVSDRRVQNLTLDQNWTEVGQKLSGKVQLAGEGRADQRLFVSLLDRRNREIVRQVMKADTPEQAFSFDVPSWLPMLLQVRATLVEGTQEIASAWQYARVVKRHRGRFNFVMWDVPGGNLSPWAEQALANTGVTVHLSSAAPLPLHAAYEMAWIPYTTHIGAARDEQGIMKPACWADEARIQTHVDSIVAKHIPARRHGVLAYSLGDEIAVRGSCLSPHCLAAYRKYLREQYGDIAALNASWGSHYSSFDEVQLSKADDINESEALRAGYFPRWFDRQAYQSHNFRQLCERFGKGFRRIDPESRCGFEGAGTFREADDLDGFVRSNSFWSPYPGPADEVLRSIAPRDFPRSNWMGYTKDADSLLEKYWRMITRGCDSVWWWRWDALGRFHGWLAPNLDPFPAVKEILCDTQIVRAGLSDLLLASQMQTDGIGILYSLPSGYAARVQDSPTYGSYESSHTAFHYALRSLGLNFLYFTDRQMRLGEVDLGQFKVIILPMTQALDRREADLLRAYVRRGGVLIADVRPAIYDGHVKPLPAGQLDDVFGIRRTGFAAASPGEAVILKADHELPSLKRMRVRADAGVQATKATAAGVAEKAPLLLVHPFGQGRAILLNLGLSNLQVLGSKGTPEEAAAEIVQWALAPTGVVPPLSLAGANGQRLRDVELTRWCNGPVQIVSLFRHQGLPEMATLNLPRPLHVYDLKAARDLGKQQSVSLTVTPYRAQFFALSPQPLRPVEVQVTPVVQPGGLQRVRVASTLSDGQQAVKVHVLLPDGSLADWFSAVVVTDKQGVVVNVPVAYNDPRGTWTVKATELYTGTTATVQFTVP
jgi:beta-galactosidase